MLLYMAVRYEATDTGYNLEMLDSIPSAGSYYGKLSTLLQWHYEDPPDSWEFRRNNRIQERQGNRNPFIDHPEYVSNLWAPKVIWAAPNGDGSIAVSWTHALNAVSYLVDVSEDSLFSTFIIQNQGVAYANLGSFTVGAENVVYFRIKAFYGSGDGPYSPVCMIDLNAPPLVISYFNVTLVGDLSGLAEWTSETETNLMGYYLMRSQNNQILEAMLVSPLIPATNTSSTQNYSFTDSEIPPSETGGWVYYWLNALDMNGESYYYGPDSIYVEPSSAQDESMVPNAKITSVYPNPFSAELNLELDLKAGTMAELEIYNLKGQRVKSWTIAGTSKQNIVWNGLDEKGNAVASGVYLLRLKASHHTETHKLLKLN
jgi:hypothetical protein